MVYLLTTLHVIFCLFLILVILLQTGKGGGMGSAFGGGGSSTVFGPRGPGSFIAKLTGVVATLFMVTAMLLAYLSSSKATDLEAKVAALADVKHEGTEVDLGGLEKTVPVDEKKPAIDAGAAPLAPAPAEAAPIAAPPEPPAPVPAAAPAPVPAAPKATVPAAAPRPKPAPVPAPAAPVPAPAPVAPAPATSDNPY
jgi:preprotein translocase subunit SecG